LAKLIIVSMKGVGTSAASPKLERGINPVGISSKIYQPG
jgi:hypothetical protein